MRQDLLYDGALYPHKALALCPTILLGSGGRILAYAAFKDRVEDLPKSPKPQLSSASRSTNLSCLCFRRPVQLVEHPLVHDILEWALTDEADELIV
jgi:hypothetical protein